MRSNNYFFLAQFTRCLILALCAKKLTNPCRNFWASQPPFSTIPHAFSSLPHASAICFSRCCYFVCKAGAPSACSAVSPRQSRCWDVLLTIPFHPFYKLGLSCSIHGGAESNKARVSKMLTSPSPSSPVPFPEASPFLLKLASVPWCWSNRPGPGCEPSTTISGPGLSPPQGYEDTLGRTSLSLTHEQFPDTRGGGERGNHRGHEATWLYTSCIHPKTLWHAEILSKHYMSLISTG